jgi:hypothetical protein
MVPGPGHWAYLVREYGGSVRIKKDFFIVSKNVTSASTRTPPSSGLTYAR